MDAISYDVKDHGEYGFIRECILPFVTLLAADKPVFAVTSPNTDLFFATSDGDILQYQESLPGNYVFATRIQCQGFIKRLLVLPRAQILLALVTDQCHIYSTDLLKAGPLRRIKGVIDVLLAHNGDSEQVLLARVSLVKFLSFSKSKAITVSQLAYTDTITAMALDTPGYCIIANQQSYDLIDTLNHRKITLFEHGLDPQLVPFTCPGDQFRREYLLTIQADLESVMAMFVDNDGHATRGTLVWAGHGTLQGQVCIQWPFVYAIFRSSTLDVHNLVVSSLETLQQVAFYDLSSTLNMDIVHVPTPSIADDETVITESIRDQIELEVLSSESKNEEPVVANVVDTRPQRKIHLNYIETAVTLEFVCPKLGWVNVKSGGKQISGELVLAQGNIMICWQNQTFVVHPENDFNYIVSQFETWPVSSLDEFSARILKRKLEGKIFHGAQLSFCVQLFAMIEIHLGHIDLAIMYLLTPDQNNLLVVEPQVAVYLIARDPMDFCVFQGIFDACHRLNPGDLDIANTYLSKALFSSIASHDIAQVRKTAYRFLSLDQLLEFLDIDTHWQAMDETNSEILRNLQQKKADGLLVRVYQRLLLEDTSPSIAAQFCELATSLIRNNNIYALLVADIFPHLDKVDDKSVYSKTLVHLFELAQTDTIEYLERLTKANKPAKFRDVYREFMLKIASTGEHTISISKLKIEHLEQDALLKDKNDNKELLLELLAFSRRIFTDECSANFDSLQKAFPIETSLLSDIWPKVTWPDFLRIAGPHSECAQFVELYLKIYELCLAGVASTALDLILKPPYTYIAMVLSKDCVINGLLNHSDYSSAEFYAIHGHSPAPQKPYYPTLLRQQQQDEDDDGPDQIRDRLAFIFLHYVQQYRKAPISVRAIQHFISAYGTTVFAASDVMSMLPPDLPLVHVQVFLHGALLLSNAQMYFQLSQKALLRANIKEIQGVCRSLNS